MGSKFEKGSIFIYLSAYLGCPKMSIHLGDESFASEEDLFFHKLFAEDELSQRNTSKSTYVNLNYCQIFL